MNDVARTMVRAGYETLLVHPAHAEEAISRAHALMSMSPEAFDRLRGDKSAEAWGAYRVEAGVALIPVLGTLVPRGTFVGSAYGVTSYEGLRAELRRAAADTSVSRIALLIDSPGGYVSGVDATAAAIRAAGETKPVVAYVQGMACSAAYWLASQADAIVASPLAEVGSIGVVQAHVDISKVLDDFGVKVTLLHAGAKKVDGNPYEPLPERVRIEMEQRLEDLRTEFARAVADGRGIETAAVLGTEAATYFGQAALDRGLADRIGLLDEEMKVLATPLGRFTLESTMTETKSEITQAQLDAAVSAARAEGHSAGLTEGRKEGAVAERTRIAAILDNDAAKGREGLARHFAFKTGDAAEAALAAMNAVPAAAADATVVVPASLAAEMAADIQPQVGGDGGRAAGSLTGMAKGAAEMKQALGMN